MGSFELHAPFHHRRDHVAVELGQVLRHSEAGERRYDGVERRFFHADRLAGDAPASAVAAAHALAGQVIRHRGAIIPRAAAAVH